MAGQVARCGRGRSAREAADDIVDADYEIVAPADARSHPPPPAGAVHRVCGRRRLAAWTMLRKPESRRCAPARPVAARSSGSSALGSRRRPSGCPAAMPGPPMRRSWRSRAGAGAAHFRRHVACRRVGLATPMLFVDGEAANDGKVSEVLPPLDIRVTGNDGLSPLQAGDIRPFRWRPVKHSPFRAASTCLRTGSSPFRSPFGE